MQKNDLTCAEKNQNLTKKLSFMKKFLLLFTNLLLFFSNSFSQNTWTQKVNFGGTARYGSMGFSIGTKGYMGTGYSTSPATYYQDFWEWDQATNVWTQKASLSINKQRHGAVGFSIGTFGYITTGFDGGAYFNDLWEYTP